MGSFKSDLPKNWELTTLGEAYQVVGGGTPSTENPAYWGGEIPWITSADIEGVRQINIRKRITEKGISESTTNKVPPKTVLVVTRVGLGKIAIAETAICFSQDLQGLIQNPELVCPEYTLHLLSYELQILKFEGRGTTISGITKKQLKDLGFPLPPISEQRRIVSKIEELFSELDAGIESLKTAQVQLKVYRQSLLKHAFEGKLTAHWREQNKDKLESAEALLVRIQTERENRYRQQLKEWEAGGKAGSSKPKASKALTPLTAEELAELPELPEGWGWTHLASVITVLSGYAFKSGNFLSEGAPVVKIANIGYSEFIEKDQEYLAPTFLDSHTDFIVSPDDLLLALTRPITNNTTKVCIYPKEAPLALLNQRVAALKNAEINADYIYAYFGTSFFKESIRSKFSETLQPNLSPKALEACPLPVCSFAEQVQIVTELESRLSETVQLDQTITTSLQQAEVLRQSILKKAFSGQLVPQDPHDEPASVLLAHIKAEQATQPKAKKARA